ncbi:hypothetical protein GCM10009801_05040 [Streptomyces albiaxialis]|uniref:Uncharacterized protein n=1 Tax=Streptomyces albiaxialis TaxID=329523 RepID=A0ABN2VHA5_9ACTN
MHSTHSTVMSRRVRVAAAGLVTAGLLGAGAATAVAAPQVPAPPEPVPAHTDPAPAAAATHHATADHTVVKAWQEFRVKGLTKGIKPGSKVVLEQKQKGTWRALPAQTIVNKSGAYTLRVKLGLKGKNELRLLAGGKPSNVLTVTVR